MGRAAANSNLWRVRPDLHRTDAFGMNQLQTVASTYIFVIANLKF